MQIISPLFTPLNLYNWLDYFPVVSSITNTINIIAKMVLIQKQTPNVPRKRIYRYLMDKRFIRFFILLFPIIGNIMIGVYDYARYKRARSFFDKGFAYDQKATLETARSNLSDDHSSKKSRVYNSNFQNAILQYQSAAHLGNSDAMAAIGRAYESGCGVETNIAIAISWYRKAILHDNPQAMLYLGNCYKNGKGVSIDGKEAHYWFYKSAKCGNSDSMNVLAEIYLYGMDGIAQDHQQAFYWLQESSRRGNMQAVANLGHCYKYGYGTEKDLRMALMCYKMAIGNPP